MTGGFRALGKFLINPSTIFKRWGSWGRSNFWRNISHGNWMIFNIAKSRPNPPNENSTTELYYMLISKVWMHLELSLQKVRNRNFWSKNWKEDSCIFDKVKALGKILLFPGCPRQFPPQLSRFGGIFFANLKKTYLCLVVAISFHYLQRLQHSPTWRFTLPSAIFATIEEIQRPRAMVSPNIIIYIIFQYDLELWYFIFLLQLRSFSGGDLPADLTMNPKSSVVGYYGMDLISDNLMEMQGGKGEIHYFKTKLACCSIVLQLLASQRQKLERRTLCGNFQKDVTDRKPCLRFSRMFEI